MIALGKHATKQRPAHQKATLPAYWRYHLISRRLVAPDKRPALGNLALEKLLILAAQALGIKRFVAGEELAPQQHIAGAALLEIENSTRGYDRTFVESTFNNPPRSIVVEVRVDRTEHAITR